jgi:hypothetical protein
VGRGVVEEKRMRIVEALRFGEAQPPESDEVFVDVEFLPTGSDAEGVNTVSFPSGPGDGLAQVSYQCQEPDKALGTRKTRACEVPVSGAVNVITNVVNTVGTQKAAQRYELWCSKDGGTAQRLTQECGEFGLCLRDKDDRVTAHGFNPEAALLPVPEGITFQQGGSFINQETAANLTPIDDDKVIENIYALQTGPGLTPKVTDFSCVQTAPNGVALEGTNTPIVIEIRRGVFIKK